MLRAATGPRHAQAEAAFARHGLDSLDGYRRLLRAHEAARQAIRPLLLEDAATGPTRTAVNDALTLLGQDLAELDGAASGPAAAPGGGVQLHGRAFRLGLAYVVEGSRLGASILLGQLDRTGLSRPKRFLAHEKDGVRLAWPAFLRRLEGDMHAIRSPDALVEGACAAFRIFQDAAGAQDSKRMSE